jgi:hypothetical protein
MGAKQSKLDKLHELYTAELTRQLKDGDEAPSAALLAVIGNFLSRSGVKATNDSPTISDLARSYSALPFRADDNAKASPASKAN